MTFPASLPWMIEYRCGKQILTTLPRRAVEYLGSAGMTTANIVRPQIPYGVDGWRRINETEWRALETLPEAWMPFLNRQRGTVMDPRPKEKA